MALTYRNTLRGHIVNVAEPADILATAEMEAERLTRLGTKRARVDAELVMDKAQSQAIHQRQTLAKMDESRRWERYTAPPVMTSDRVVDTPEFPVKAARAKPVKAAEPETEA
jgi:hypothetical protein